MPRNDPLRNFRFRLEIDGITQAGFSEASGFDVSIDAIDYREGNEPTHVRKLPQLLKYRQRNPQVGNPDSNRSVNAIADRPIGKSNELACRNRRQRSSNDKARFEITEAWPMKYDPMDLNAKGNDVWIETLEFVNEGVKRTA